MLLLLFSLFRPFLLFFFLFSDRKNGSKMWISDAWRYVMICWLCVTFLHGSALWYFSAMSSTTSGVKSPEKAVLLPAYSLSSNSPGEHWNLIGKHVQVRWNGFAPRALIPYRVLIVPDSFICDEMLPNVGYMSDGCWPNILE